MKRKNEICKMSILVVAATNMEITPFIADNKGVDILVTGVGMPAALYHIQKKLGLSKYDFVIQAGIAGAFTSAIELSDVVIVGKDTFGDIGMEDNASFTPIFQSGFMDKNEFPFTDGWLINNNPLLQLCSLPIVSAITVNKVSDSAIQKQQSVNNFNAQIESMEGAALHYICLQEHVPFMQLRSISNYVGERDKSKWKMKASIQNLNEALPKMIQTILMNQL
ncbi:MAG: futalosine hydrolase [Ferruginibacter sp.]